MLCIAFSSRGQRAHPELTKEGVTEARGAIGHHQQKHYRNANWSALVSSPSTKDFNKDARQSRHGGEQAQEREADPLTISTRTARVAATACAAAKSYSWGCLLRR